MFMIAAFDHSIYLESALSLLEKNGINDQNILAVPLENRDCQNRLFDTIHHSDGTSLFDLGAALATALAVIGASIGFQLKWGPIIWGLIGAATGFTIGLIIDILMTRKKEKGAQKNNTEVILIICCQNHEETTVEKILWENQALRVGKLNV
ncbi:hypothetical protein JOD45_002763 [Scopulibacillus daqui]|uniref:Uncharacterized protein n=1 Tax=Scopulibacillus daqui TaxID=1469162 RepID=A0ABS2Q2K4_9BACL|nr:hypothetical protein [Scopulibacillus daqui]MBM7646533.1 hypothetical protein [Scopulibacillus daqui]